MRRALATAATMTFAIVQASAAIAADDDATPRSATVSLHMAPAEYRMGGFPPGMTERTFEAGSGEMTVTALGPERTRIRFDLEGLIPNGVYTLWNVLQPMPNFKDEPLGPKGYGKHGLIADAEGEIETSVYLNERPGEIFLLDYHADGKLTGKKGEVVFPGALFGHFPDVSATSS